MDGWRALRHHSATCREAGHGQNAARFWSETDILAEWGGGAAMKRGLLVALLTVGVGATVALTTGVLLKAGARAAESVSAKDDLHRQPRRVAGPQPNTSSPDWKELSADVGVMIRNDDRLGLRGRLYVRVDGLWYPVATDGPADVRPTVPVR